MPSNPPRTQREAVQDLCHVAGVDPVKVKEYPRLLIHGLGLFNPLMRELPEVSYQLEDLFILDSTAAPETFDVKPTPWDDVLAEVIAGFR